MKQNQQLHIVFSEVTWGKEKQLQIFALLNLGIIQSLASGVLSAAEAVRRFYHADNCLYIRKILNDSIADSIMSRGVQLPDIFDCLPADEAQREFLHELETIRSLSLKLLESV
jgi:hypothetical protein